jgi:hypothetical protein
MSSARTATPDAVEEDPEDESGEEDLGGPPGYEQLGFPVAHVMGQQDPRDRAEDGHDRSEAGRPPGDRRAPLR